MSKSADFARLGAYKDDSSHLSGADSNKRILYVTASYPYGPGEAFIGAEIAEWESRGYEIITVPVYARGKLGISAVRADYLSDLPVFSLKYIYFLLLFFLGAPSKTFRVFWDIIRGPRYLARNMLAVLKAFGIVASIHGRRFAHIHAHWGGSSSTMAMAVSRLAGVPWSMTCHRWDIYANNLLAVKSHSAVFTRFISEGAHYAGLERGADPIRSTVIHMGVANVLDEPVRHLPVARPVIACPANLIILKGHKYLFEAVAILKQRGRSVTLRLYGDGVMRDALGEDCRRLGIEDEVVFEGHVHHSNLLAAFESGEVNLVVLPSLDMGNGDHEGIPVSLIEAMGFGIPVISTLTGSIPELLPESLGLTVPPGDALALSQKISELLNDPERYRRAAYDVLDVIRRGWSVSASVDAIEQKIFGTKPVRNLSDSVVK